MVIRAPQYDEHGKGFQACLPESLAINAEDYTFWQKKVLGRESEMESSDLYFSCIANIYVYHNYDYF
ncbi:hypothetical protein I3843_08G043800 [Carya illinoinensis]|uniref:Uncharacterized protein n=1 Tax=Carya illinoinensis TaxID=32201 RepID=A0A8T1PSL9_CARIL|nr:hypothetical protein CIPAW_08G043000 [Carya illinoinensis]KAG6698924.1 hypothetical protein I3842_08G044100 [Carya illinoinensis]KAG7966300.1 hypothetical protein I3843_08G043800 [Carya illinoinensis]KAG7966301.1 hypothetical protein I3843_08G043800 [Carya illinoinensis]